MTLAAAMLVWMLLATGLGRQLALPRLSGIRSLFNRRPRSRPTLTNADPGSCRYVVWNSFQTGRFYVYMESRSGFSSIPFHHDCWSLLFNEYHTLVVENRSIEAYEVEVDIDASLKKQLPSDLCDRLPGLTSLKLKFGSRRILAKHLGRSCSSLQHLNLYLKVFPPDVTLHKKDIGFLPNLKALTITNYYPVYCAGYAKLRIQSRAIANLRHLQVL